MTNKKYKILLVDDERDILSIIKHGLENEGSFEVDAFHDPEEALSQFKLGKYDLLLLDIRMPKMNGFELYRELRKIDEKTKICFITAFEIYYDEFRKMFPKVRVDCFVHKPVHLEHLAKTIREEIELKQQMELTKERTI
ncbi:MAG TPA: response regulator [Nitrososphaera sp.]|nr:response regulator [Nitrososphaera sp.]